MTDPQLKQWWDDVHSAFTEILYRYDPLDMGSTVGAPDDEYFDEATRTLRSLVDLTEAWGLSQAIESRWPGADTAAMREELEEAWRPPPKAAP